MREEVPIPVRTRVQGYDADGAGLDPAVSAAAFPPDDPDLFPRQRTQPPQQRGLVQLRCQEVVTAAFVQVIGVVAVGVDSVGSEALPT